MATTSGRFVRNLALSLSGGAVLTVVGASAAAAQDGGSAGTDSDGAGAAHSGDATAVGNRSGTQKAQTGAASGTVGGLQVVEQGAAVANVGVAVADTGNNRAVGNESTNTGTATQNATGDPGPASNNGSVANASTGSARISTGDTSAIGNDSVTRINQHSDSAAGALGGILVVQNAVVTNSGIALASSGSNTAIGNTSISNGVLNQLAVASPGLAANSARVGNTSGGAATISTGSASAVGNKSESAVLQSANGSAGDGGDGGLVLLPQTAIVVNAGEAAASAGNNNATGADTITQAQHLNQAAVAVDGPLVPGIASNTADLSTTSDGDAWITTGAAHATGNLSNTEIDQDIDPSGLVIDTQLAAVLNAGVGQATTGGNTAVGNQSGNTVQVESQIAAALAPVVPAAVLAAAPLASNTADVSATSDGSASIVTGSASASGNESTTTVHQDADGDVDGPGLVLNTQIAAVGNVGVGAANTGGNLARGNQSLNVGVVGQTADAATTLPAAVLILTGPVVASNVLAASATSDGSATTWTGDAHAIGNRSDTDLNQGVEGMVDGAGAVLTTQLGVVANAGQATANTGNNTAFGNSSGTQGFSDQGAQAINFDLGPITLVAPAIIGSNSATMDLGSDGSAAIRTGAATAYGNQSSTDLEQVADGRVDGFGLVVETQVAPVINAGVAQANTGGNTAFGNISTNGNINIPLGLIQNAAVASINPVPVTLLAAGPITASNNGALSSASDGTADIRTGDATARGNLSSTEVDQHDPALVDGFGAVLHTQVAPVLNVGSAAANTGGNTARGNESTNAVTTDQLAQVATGLAQPLTLVALGPITASNSAELGNTSDGTAKVGTGNATATGNTSSTRLSQELDGSVTVLGLVVDTQAAVVVNAGDAAGSTGNNTAIGNTSQNSISPSVVVTDQTAVTVAVGSVVPSLVLGPVTAANDLSTTNASDGEACVCTGDAIASGNIADTELSQDLDANVGTGAVVLTQAGGILNLGQAVANTGQNQATGNNSTNTVTVTQTSTVPVLQPIDIAQTAHNGANAANTSRGTAGIGTGKAHAIGNLSTTSFAQEATADGPAFATQLGGTGNVGVGIANTGINIAHGQRLDQHRRPHPVRDRLGDRVQRGVGHQRLRRLRPDRRPGLLPRGGGPRQARPARHRRRRDPTRGRRGAPAAPRRLRPAPRRPQGLRLASRSGLVRLDEVA